MHASRIADIATARHAMRDGLVDLIGMTRAQIADPHLVASSPPGTRTASGRASAPATAWTRSTRTATPSASTTRPPAGNCTCRTSCRRPARRAGSSSSAPGRPGWRPPGCWVSAATSSPSSRRRTPGGQVRLAARARPAATCIGIVDWRVAECARLDVKIHCKPYADERRCCPTSPTSSWSPPAACPTRPPWCADIVWSRDAWDVLAGAAPRSGAVLLYDDNGGHAGLDAARVLLDSGRRWST